jgi:hypothetical protein
MSASSNQPLNQLALQMTQHKLSLHTLGRNDHPGTSIQGHIFKEKAVQALSFRANAIPQGNA